MQSSESLFNLDRQNDKVSIRIISPTFGHLPFEITKRYGLTHRKTYYFLFFMVDGVTRHGIDLEQYDKH